MLSRWKARNIKVRARVQRILEKGLAREEISRPEALELVGIQ